MDGDERSFPPKFEAFVEAAPRPWSSGLGRRPAPTPWPRPETEERPRSARRRGTSSLASSGTRLEKGLALADVAEPLGLTSRLIAQYERKGLSMPTAEKLAMMAAILGVSTSYLVDLSTTSELDEAPKDAWIKRSPPLLDKLDAEEGGRRS
jgi:hypothetical protein